MITRLIIIISLLAGSAPLFGNESSFLGKPLPDLLQYTGARCAFLVQTIKISREMDYVYSTSVEARQEMRWGEESQFDREQKVFQIATINNLRNGHVPQDEGDDYYLGSLSPNQLKERERYIFLCRGGDTFEAISASEKNIAKIKLFMNSSWKNIYAKKATIQELLGDLRDPDLYIYAYENLKKRGKLNLNLVTAAIKSSPDIGLLALHLRNLADPEDLSVSVDDEHIEVKSSNQLAFLQFMINELSLEKNEVLFSAVTKIVDDPTFFQTINDDKSEAINLYLGVLNKQYKEKLADRNRLLVQLASTLQANQKFAFRFQEHFFLYAASVNDPGKTLTIYLDSLRAKERVAFLVKLTALYEALAMVKRETKAHISIFKILEAYLPENPSPYYLKKLGSFNPFYLDAKMQSFEQFEKFAQSNEIWQVQEKCAAIISGTNMVVRTLNAILQKDPASRDEVRRVGDVYTGAKSVFRQYLDIEQLHEYETLLNSTAPLGVAGPGKTVSENGNMSVH